MNDNIRFFLSHSEISPVGYTWMDLSGYGVTKEEWDEVLARVGKLNTIPIKDYPLPFERMAIVSFISPLATAMSQKNESVTLATIDRIGNELLYIFHLYVGSSKNPAVIAKVADVPPNSPLRDTMGKDGKGMTFKFEKEYIKISKLNGLKESDVMKAHGNHIESLIRKVVALSIKPDPVVTVGRPYGDEVRNAKRQRKGKTQFWEWKTIELKPTTTLPSAPLGGTHASPKPHERIGHWRQYKSGKRVFIKAHIVNKHKIETDGFVFHDYVKLSSTKKEKNEFNHA